MPILSSVLVGRNCFLVLIDKGDPIYDDKLHSFLFLLIPLVTPKAKELFVT